MLGHAALAKQISTPVCLDDSITSARAAADAITLGVCAIVNVKPGRVGGYLEAKRIHDVCGAHGVPVWCGGMLETGLGWAANVALAPLPGFTMPGDTSGSERYCRTDITSPFVLSADRVTHDRPHRPTAARTAGAEAQTPSYFFRSKSLLHLRSRSMIVGVPLPGGR